jgi:hypothetical protein
VLLLLYGLLLPRREFTLSEAEGFRVAVPAFLPATAEESGIPLWTGFQPVKLSDWKPVPRGNDTSYCAATK